MSLSCLFPKILVTFIGIKSAFGDATHFNVQIKDPTTSGGSILACDEKSCHDADLAPVSVFISVVSRGPE